MNYMKLLKKNTVCMVILSFIFSAVLLCPWLTTVNLYAGETVSDNVGKQMITDEGERVASMEADVYHEGLQVEEVYEPLAGISEADLVYEEDFANNRRIASYYAPASNNEWDRYRTNYIRNRFTQESMIEAWDYFDGIFSSYLNSADNIPKKVTPYYIASSVKWSREDALKFWSAFYYSNPQYYFVKSTFRYTKTSSGYYGVGFEIYQDFLQGSHRAETTRLMKNNLDEICLTITGDTAYQKVSQIYDKVCDVLTYKANFYDQSLYSSLILKETVCAGYAALFQCMCNYFDIPVVEAVSESHGWNRVRINDTWYEIDTTNADQNNYISNTYFLRSSDRIRSLTNFYEVTESIALYLPVCETDSGSTSGKKGNAVESLGVLQTPDISENNEGLVTLKADMGEIYYTVDGSVPSSFYRKSRLYTGPFTPLKNQTVRAVAVLNRYADSPDSSYTVKNSTRETDNKKYGIIYESNNVPNIVKGVTADGKKYGSINMISTQKTDMSEVFGISDEFYKSDDPKIAKVSKTGKITAKKKGETKVYAFNASGKVSGFVEVTVYNVRMKKINSTSQNSMFNARDYLDLDGYQPLKLEFKSKKETVVTVSENFGILNTVGNGSAKIIALVDDVPVTGKFVAKLPKLNKKAVTLAVGKSKKLKVAKTKKNVTFITDNPDIVSVTPVKDRMCQITANKSGKTRIKAVVDGNELICEVTVQ